MYASALNGIAGPEPDQMAEDMAPLLQLIVDRVPPPPADPDGPFQMQICALDYSNYVGVIGVGRITRGTVRPGMQVAVIDADGAKRNARILSVLGHLGLEKQEVPQGEAGDIISITGIDGLKISATLCAPDAPEPLPPLHVDQPTVSMTFQVNDSPFAGREGQFVTSRNIRDRLDRELLHDVALRVQEGSTPDRFVVSGRGELHLSVLIEKMRREGYELGVSRPEVIRREVEGVIHEPYEMLLVDCEEGHQGGVMEELGRRRGELRDMVPDGKGRVRLEYLIPSRGIIGFRSQFLTMTSGTGILTHIFDHYGPLKPGEFAARINGVLVSMVTGKALGYALFNLQERGRLCIGANVEIYEGQIIGLHSRDNDLTVNPTKAKQLTNIRAAGSDENILLTPPIRMSLEQALEFIEDDELVEVTPQNIRVRKRFLKEPDRRRAERQKSGD
jgi:GTP-binding protein